MKGSRIHQVNRCRTFLKVLTLADITTPDGTQLDNNAIIGRRNKSNYSKLKWPPQNPIHAEGWKVWTTFLQQEYCNPNSYTLKRPLGDWIKGKGHKIWNLYQDIRTGDVYRRESECEQSWTRHSPTPENKLILNVRTGMSCPPPLHAFRVSFKSTTSKTWIIYESNKQPMRIPPSEQVPTTNDNEEEFMHRLYGHHVHPVKRHHRTMERLAAAIHCR